MREERPPVDPLVLHAGVPAAPPGVRRTGYPPLRTDGGEVRQLAGEEIPLIGRIAAVADIYDAVSSSRPFRNPFHPVDAIRILRIEKGKKLDPELAEAFAKVIYPFPIGSTVVLTTQELAVVMGYADEDKFQPIVKPIMKKVRNNGREEVVRLPWAAQQGFTITPELEDPDRGEQGYLRAGGRVLPLTRRSVRDAAPGGTGVLSRMSKPKSISNASA